MNRMKLNRMEMKKEQDAELDETQQDANKKLNFPWLSEDLRVNLSVGVNFKTIFWNFDNIILCRYL